MNKTEALAQARHEINLGMDGRSVRFTDDEGRTVEVIPSLNYWMARAEIADARLERALDLLGFDDPGYYSHLYDSGTLGERLSRSIAAACYAAADRLASSRSSP